MVVVSTEPYQLTYDITGLAIDGSGDVFIADQYIAQIVEILAGGGPATLVNTEVSPGVYLTTITGLAVDASGDVYVCAENNGAVSVWKISPGDSPVVFADSGNTPFSVTVDPAGNLFFADLSGFLQKVTPTGMYDGGFAADIGFTGLLR